MPPFLADRRVRIAGGAVLALVAGLILLIAAFPYGMLKGTIEERLTRRFGRAVTIGTMRRVDRFGFHPVIELGDVRIPGPRWAGADDLARISRARIGFDALPLLLGRFAAREIDLAGARLTLVRAKDGRESWRETSDRRGPGGKPLDALIVRDSRLVYRDAKQDRQIDVAFASDAANGLRLAGAGHIRDVPVKVALRAPAIAGASDGRWPFEVRLAGDGLTIHARGAMDAPLDTGHMTLDVTAQARDLKLIDAVIEAGLFRTQPVTLSAHVVRTPARWAIERLDGRIGRSDLSGRLTVDKIDGRSKLDGEIVSRQLDFDDLSSDEGLARGAARKRALGPRIVPDTRINLARIGRTDGQITFKVGSVVSRHGPSSITSLAGTLALDHRVATIAPLRIGLRQGAITGRAVIDQGDDGPVPMVRLDLRLSGSSIPALAGGGGAVTGRVDGRAVLAGRGSTLREAVGASSGRIGLAARDGSLPEEIAAALGFDAGRAIFASKEARAGLRCVIVGADLRGGQGRVGPFVVDTTQSRLEGEGTIGFPGETLDIRLTGAPKQGAVLRLPGATTMTGTISEPDIVVPREVKSVGNILKALSRAITGKQGPAATDADCAGLAAQVLR